MKMHAIREERLLVYAVLLISVAVLGSSAQAQLPEPDIYIIPDQLSAESSFVMVADPGSVDGPVRIVWVSGEGYGLFPYINEKYMCYFSDTDENAICGPSPFRVPTTPGYPYMMDVSSFDSGGDNGTTATHIEVGGLKLDPRVSVSSNGNAMMVVYVSGGNADSVRYRVYDSSFSAITSSYQSLSLIPESGAFNGSVSLGTGVYYIAFKANSTTDFGGGIYRVNTGGSSGTSYGILTAESLDIEMFVDEGAYPTVPVNKRITNGLNQTFTGVSIDLPATEPIDIRSYIRISPSNSTIFPNSFVYYNVSFIKAIDRGMDIYTTAIIKSGTSELGTIPVRVKLSVRGSTTSDCSNLPDREKCLGGLCCSGVCRDGADCCSSTDCLSGTCDSNYRCTTDALSCSSGLCRISCYSGEEASGETCTTSGGSQGICCVAAANECEGETDGTSCSGGYVCYFEQCVECYEDDNCLSGYECSTANTCIEITVPEPEFDLFTIILIIAVIAAAGVGAFIFLKKFRKKASAEDEFEKDKDDEEEAFDEDEFY